MQYPYRVFKCEAEGHIFWIAKSTMLKGCVGQGDTQEQAVEELEENEVAWIETAREYSIPIPESPADDMLSYNGKLNILLSQSDHRKKMQIA